MALKPLVPNAELVVETAAGFATVVSQDTGISVPFTIDTPSGLAAVVIDSVVELPISIETPAGFADAKILMVEDSGGGSVVSIRADYSVGVLEKSDVRVTASHGMGELKTAKAQFTLSAYFVLETTHYRATVDYNYWVPETVYQVKSFASGMGILSNKSVQHLFSYTMHSPTLLRAKMLNLYSTVQKLAKSTVQFTLAYDPYVVYIKHALLDSTYEVRSLAGVGWEKMEAGLAFGMGVNTAVVASPSLANTVGVLHLAYSRPSIAYRMGKNATESIGFGAEYAAARVGTPKYMSVTMNYAMRSLAGVGYEVLDFTSSWAQLATADRVDFNIGYANTYLSLVELGIAYARNFSTEFINFSLFSKKERYLLGGITLDARFSVRSGVEVVYSLLDYVRAGSVLPAGFSDRAIAGFAIDCKANALRVGHDVDAPLNMFVSAGIDIPLQYVGAVRYGKEISVPINYLVVSGMEIAYDLLSYTPVMQGLVVSSPIMDMTPIVRSNPYVLPDPTGVKQQGIPLVSAEIVADEGSYAWQGTFEIVDPMDLNKFRPHAPFTFTLGTDTYTFLVDSKVYDRSSPSERKAVLKGISPTAELAAPRARLITKTWTASTTAHAIINEVLGGYPADIRILNWAIPANRFGVENTSPLDIISQLATAVGGIVDSTLDGVLRVRPKYPVSVPLWGPSTMDHAYGDAEDIYSSQDDDAPVRIFDKFRIMDEQASVTGDRLEYTELTITSGEVRAYPYPWRTDCYLDTTSPSCTIGPAVIEYRDEEEIIEIYNGAGEVAFPVVSVNLLQWMEVDLLGVVAGNDLTKITTTHPTEMFSLLKINYKTRCLVYPVSGAVGQEAQFLLRNP